MGMSGCKAAAVTVCSAKKNWPCFSKRQECSRSISLLYSIFLHNTQTYCISLLELYCDSTGCVDVHIHLRPNYTKAGHLHPGREFVRKRDIEYQFGTVGQSVYSCVTRPLGGSGGMPPRKSLGFRPSEIVFGSIWCERKTVGQAAAKPSHCTSPPSLMHIPCTCIHGSRQGFI